MPQLVLPLFGWRRLYVDDRIHTIADDAPHHCLGVAAMDGLNPSPPASPDVCGYLGAHRIHVRTFSQKENNACICVWTCFVCYLRLQLFHVCYDLHICIIIITILSCHFFMISRDNVCMQFAICNFSRIGWCFVFYEKGWCCILKLFFWLRTVWLVLIDLCTIWNMAKKNCTLWENPIGDV